MVDKWILVSGVFLVCYKQFHYVTVTVGGPVSIYMYTHVYMYMNRILTHFIHVYMCIYI